MSLRLLLIVRSHYLVYLLVFFNERYNEAQAQQYIQTIK